jgi:hypothetical protein
VIVSSVHSFKMVNASAMACGVLVVLFLANFG